MLGAKPPAKQPLKKLLVTGDSLSQPLDADLGKALADKGVKVTRDAHIGTGISATDLLDWGRLAATQAKDEPDAVVMFIGANDTYPMKDPATKKEVGCCDVRLGDDLRQPGARDDEHLPARREDAHLLAHDPGPARDGPAGGGEGRQRGDRASPRSRGATR